MCDVQLYGLGFTKFHSVENLISKGLAIVVAIVVATATF